MDLDNLIIKLTKKLRYLLSSTSNNLKTLYFIYCLDFTLE